MLAPHPSRLPRRVVVVDVDVVVDVNGDGDGLSPTPTPTPTPTRAGRRGALPKPIPPCDPPRAMGSPDASHPYRRPSPPDDDDGPPRSGSIRAVTFFGALLIAGIGAAALIPILQQARAGSALEEAHRSTTT